MRSISLPIIRIEPGLRRYVSATLALVMAGGLVVVPLSMLDGYFQRRDEIEAVREDLRRLQAKSVAAVERSSAPFSNPEQVPILAPNAEIAAAHIQATLRELTSALASEEIRIGSVRVLPALVEGSVTAVRATASLTAPGARVFDVVNAIEASAPPIVIDSLRVASRTEASGMPGRDHPRSEVTRAELTIVMRVHAQSGPVVPQATKSVDKRGPRDPRLP